MKTVTLPIEEYEELIKIRDTIPIVDIVRLGDWRTANYLLSTKDEAFKEIATAMKVNRETVTYLQDIHADDMQQLRKIADMNIFQFLKWQSDYRNDITNY